MKNIIFKSLVIGVLVMGVSIVANAQDSPKTNFKINSTEEVKQLDLSHIKKLKAEKLDAEKKQNRVVPKKVQIKDATHMRLEKAPEKRTVK